MFCQETASLALALARYIEVSAEVRYWEDARLNGVADTEGRIPGRNGVLWEVLIDLATGQVLGWPEGLTARIHYKVCDAGLYWLLDADRTRIARWRGAYVPDEVLCVGTSGSGDYLIFNIAADGRIEGWAHPYLDPDRWLPCQAA